MNPDLVIIRDGQGYRILHGLLWITGVLSVSKEVLVDVKDEGRLVIIKTHTGLQITKENGTFPLSLH